MVCQLCLVFPGAAGDPCDVCRTHSRIGFLLPRLHPAQLERALGHLRICAGGITDLFETAGRLFLDSQATTVAGGVPVGSGKEGDGTKSPEKTREEDPDKEKKGEKREKERAKTKRRRQKSQRRGKSQRRAAKKKKSH